MKLIRTSILDGELSKAKFAELSDEMMELVSWENVEPLPGAEKRRMKELEYLLIG